MSDRRAVRGGRAALAVKTIFQNGMQRCVGMGIDLQGTTTSSIQAIATDGLGNCLIAGPISGTNVGA